MHGSYSYKILRPVRISRTSLGLRTLAVIRGSPTPLDLERLRDVRATRACGYERSPATTAPVQRPKDRQDTSSLPIATSGAVDRRCSANTPQFPQSRHQIWGLLWAPAELCTVPPEGRDHLAAGRRPIATPPEMPRRGFPPAGTTGHSPQRRRRVPSRSTTVTRIGPCCHAVRVRVRVRVRVPAAG